MNNEKEGLPQNEEGLSFREIFRIIGKKIWYVLGGSLLVTLAASLIFMFAISPAIRSDSMSFEMDYPKYSEGKYPDGSVINYNDMISVEVIEAAKKTVGHEKEFASIDTKSVIENEAIMISSEKNLETGTYLYTITIKKSYFKRVDSHDFIVALTEAFKSVIIVDQKVDNSFDFQLKPEIFSNASYKDQITLLSDLKSTLLNQYNSWISTYSAGRLVNGKPLNSYRAEVITVFADNVKTPIENILTFKGYEYFNKNVTVDDVRDRVEQLQDELKLDLAILRELKNYYTESSPAQANEAAPYAVSSSHRAAPFAGAAEDGGGSTGGDIVIMPGDSDLSQKMAYYSERAAILQQQIIWLTNREDANEETDVSKIDFKKVTEEIKKFGSAYLDGQLDALNQKAEILTSVISAIYSKDTAVIFSSQTVESTGDISTILVAVGVFIIAFLAFSLMAYTIGKQNIVKQTRPAQLVEGESESNQESENNQNE